MNNINYKKNKINNYKIYNFIKKNLKNQINNNKN